MSVKIIIETIDYNPATGVARSAQEQVDEALMALGFMRRPFTGAEASKKIEMTWAVAGAGERDNLVAALKEKAETVVKRDEERSGAGAPQALNPLGDEMAKLENPADLKTGAEAPDVDLAYAAPVDAPKRLPGQPSPGKRRRTAEQVAEDEALEKKHAQTAAPVVRPPLISTGAERVDPAIVAQDEADEADEARETAANRTGLTLDDVRAAFSTYSKTVGLPKAVETIREIVGCPLAEIPNTQEALAAAIAKIEKANAFVGSAAAEPPAQATKADCLEVLMAYGKKYDGSNDPTQMKFTQQDGSAIMTEVFGKPVTGLSAKLGFPESPENYAKALAAFNAALRNNPFKRAVVS